jgi:hypothetical protein
MSRKKKQRGAAARPQPASAAPVSPASPVAPEGNIDPEAAQDALVQRRLTVLAAVHRPVDLEERDEVAAMALASVRRRLVEAELDALFSELMFDPAGAFATATPDQMRQLSRLKRAEATFAQMQAAALRRLDAIRALKERAATRTAVNAARVERAQVGTGRPRASSPAPAEASEGSGGPAATEDGGGPSAPAGLRASSPVLADATEGRGGPAGPAAADLAEAG